MDDVLIVGAGIAGLAAAVDLTSSALKVTVLEARSRVGGRIFTHRSGHPSRPIELGAEFVHGRPPDLLSLLNEAKLPVEEATGVDACFDKEQLSSCAEATAMDILDHLAATAAREGDMSFDTFLARHPTDREEAHEVRSYVEGFNAADAGRIGIAALARQQQAEEEIDGDQSSRVRDGYDQLPRYLAQQAEQAGVRVILNTPITSVDWRAGEVSLQSQNQAFQARKAIITLPLGVLQQRRVAFNPEPSEIMLAADRMAAGPVQRLAMVFRSPFWVEKFPDMRFLFVRDLTPSTYWTQSVRDSPILIGWIGGPRAETPQARDPEQLVRQSLRSLEHTFALRIGLLDAELSSWHLHDWITDPFSLGAYSYAPAGALDCSAQMAQPVDASGTPTLFFAGEHTDITGHWGTVHGALRSGRRAARQLLASEWR